jgi:hypothetical protein
MILILSHRSRLWYALQQQGYTNEQVDEAKAETAEP